MLHATITAYRGYLVFDNWLHETQPQLSRGLEALGIRAQRIVDTSRNLGISPEALKLLGQVTVQSLGSTPNFAWFNEPGQLSELTWRGGPQFWATPGTLLAAIRSSLHGYVTISNETSAAITAQIDAELAPCQASLQSSQREAIAA